MDRSCFETPPTKGFKFYNTHEEVAFERGVRERKWQEEKRQADLASSAAAVPFGNLDTPGSVFDDVSGNTDLNDITGVRGVSGNQRKRKKTDSDGQSVPTKTRAPPRGSIIKALMDVKFCVSDVSEAITRNALHTKAAASVGFAMRIGNGYACRTKTKTNEVNMLLTNMETEVDNKLAAAVKELHSKFEAILPHCVLKSKKESASVVPIRYDCVRDSNPGESRESRTPTVMKHRKQFLNRFDVIRVRRAMVDIANEECRYLDELVAKSCVLKCPVCRVKINKKI